MDEVDIQSYYAGRDAQHGEVDRLKAEVVRLRDELAEARTLAETLLVDWVPEHGWDHYKDRHPWLEDE